MKQWNEDTRFIRKHSQVGLRLLSSLFTRNDWKDFQILEVHPLCNHSRHRYVYLVLTFRGAAVVGKMEGSKLYWINTSLHNFGWVSCQILKRWYMIRNCARVCNPCGGCANASLYSIQKWSGHTKGESQRISSLIFHRKITGKSAGIFPLVWQGHFTYRHNNLMLSTVIPST